VQAYRTEVVVKDFPRKVETLCLWGKQLLAGLQEGSLLFFKRLTPGSDEENGNSTQAESLAWQVRCVRAATVIITQLAVPRCTQLFTCYELC